MPSRPKINAGGMVGSGNYSVINTAPKETCAIIQREAAKGRTQRQIAELLGGMSLNSFQRWLTNGRRDKKLGVKSNYVEALAAWEAGNGAFREERVGKLEDKAMEIALGEVKKDKAKYPPDPSTTKFMLQKLAPDTYGDNPTFMQQINIGSDGTISVDEVSPEEWGKKDYSKVDVQAEVDGKEKKDE